MKRSSSRGLTLIEMLVTLIIVSTVTALLWQALALAARWEQGVLRQRLDGGEQRLRRAWVEQALWATVTGADGDALRFNGNASELRTYTSAPPWPATLGPDAMRLQVVRPPEGGGRRLVAERLSDGQRFELMSWSEDQGGLQYLGQDGQWRDSWPPPGPQTPAQIQRELPRAVRLNGPKPAVLVALAATRNPMLRRRDVNYEDSAR
jgi:prepilin-type N-terminal cleavage/methylation domain-containing protein